MLQAPQCLLFTEASTQSPPHSVRPVWQVTAHLPPEQTCPALQELPHRPQCLTSVLVLTQVPRQLVSPLWQETTQPPDLQISPALQVALHLPQL